MPGASSSVSQNLVGPQLHQATTASFAPSHVHAGHSASAADGHSTSMATSNSERDESDHDEEVMEMELHVTLDDQNTTQVMTAPQTFAGVGNLATMHGDRGNLLAGYQSYMQFRRHLTIPNDDYVHLMNNNTTFVRQVYDCITTTPGSMTNDQTKAVAHLTKKLQALGNDADQFMADLASMLVSAVYFLHHQGDYLFDAQFRSLKPHMDDSTMTATQRVDAICHILHNHKKHIVDLMEGRNDAVTKFTAAPKGIAKRKEDYKPNNRGRVVNKRVLTEFAKSHGKTVKDLRDGENEDEDEDEDEDDNTTV
jgi:hypothetical protein